MSNVPLHPELEGKIAMARSTIAAAFRQYRNPAILWSGGKDSMALLHLLRSMGHDLPCIHFAEPWMRGKEDFAHGIASYWELTVYDYPPSAVNLCFGNGRVDVLWSYYLGGNEPLILARGTEDRMDGLPWLCGRDRFLKRPLGAMAFPWDCVFHGHKSCDSDPTSGGVPLKVDVQDANGRHAAAAFPLREWTDAEVFSYCEANAVPIDGRRYLKMEDGYVPNPDKQANPDYFHTCFDCCRPDRPEVVRCPKNGLEIPNVAASMPWAAPQMAYCNLRTEKKED